MLLLIAACGAPSRPAEPESPYYFDQVPTYAGATFLCQDVDRMRDYEQVFRFYTTPDPLDEVVAFYEKPHGDAITQPSGPALFVRGHKEAMLTVGYVSTGYAAACDGEVPAGHETSLTVQYRVPR